MKNILKSYSMHISTYLHRVLEKFGLSRGEIDVYLLLLKNSSRDVSFLKEKTLYSSAGIYKILKSLHDRGFVVSSLSKPMIFTAVPLVQAARYFDTYSRKMARISDNLKEFSKLMSIPSDAEIHDDNELIDYYLSIPKRVNDFIWCVGSFEAVVNFFGPDIEKEFIRGRWKRGIHADAIIFDNSQHSKELAGRDKLEKRETKLIPHGSYPLEFGYLFGDTYLNFYKSDDGKAKVVKVCAPAFARAKLIQYQQLWNSTVR